MKADQDDMALRKARNAFYRLLKIRIYSEKEIRDKFRRKKFPPEVIDRTIRYFKDAELIDDVLFTKKWITYRLAKPFGVYRIKQELKEKGISAEIIDREIKQATEETSEAEQALTLAKRRALAYKGLDRQKLRTRLFGYLTRRGFSYETVMGVLKNVDR